MYNSGIYKYLDMPIAYMDVGLYGILNVSTKPIVAKWGWGGGGIKKQTPSLVVKQTLAISIFHRRPEWSLSLLTTHYPPRSRVVPQMALQSASKVDRI